MDRKLTFFMVLLLLILRDNTCSDPATNEIELFQVMGKIVTEQNKPASYVKVISIYTDTMAYRERLDSTTSKSDGTYTLTNGYPNYRWTSGGTACDNGEHVVQNSMANFLLVFISPNSDTTIASFQNGTSIPVLTEFKRIDTVFVAGYFDPSYNRYYNAPTVILKTNHL